VALHRALVGRDEGRVGQRIAAGLPAAAAAHKADEVRSGQVYYSAAKSRTMRAKRQRMEMQTMGKKTDGDEDPDGWRCKPIGKKGRGKRNKENAYDFASLLPSNTRARHTYGASSLAWPR
jgi:hypothetical protein